MSEALFRKFNAFNRKQAEWWLFNYSAIKASQKELEEQLDDVRSVAPTSYIAVGSRSGYSDPTPARAEAALQTEAHRLLSGIKAIEQVYEGLTDRERFLVDNVYLNQTMRDRKCMMEMHLEQNAYYALRRHILRKFAYALEIALRRVA